MICQDHREACRRREELDALVGSSLLVGLSRSIVLVLLSLVGEGITSSLEASADGGVVVLGNLLVGLLGSTVSGA
jgi:hypothetical protein